MKFLVLLCFTLLFQIASFAQQVKISTQLGDIIVQLEAGKAPVTVANFLKYVEGEYYKGGSFFRTVGMDNQPNSPVKIEVIQGGAHPWKQNFLMDSIPLERTKDTGLKHTDGAISMARGTPDSAQESFFICIGDQPELDFGGRRNPDGQGFAAFGRVTEGMEIVRKIQASPSEGQGLIPPILILDMVILE